jgi:glucokinase
MEDSMKDRLLSIGVDIGGTSIKVGVVDAAGKILLQRKLDTCPQRGSEAILHSINCEIAALLDAASLHQRHLAAIGLGVPGTADSASGTVVYAPNLFWRNVAIVSAIQPVFQVPVFLAQDTRAAAWAEYLAGAGRGLRGIAAITLGTGIGCGMVLDGRIFNGALNTAGEFGHQIVEIDGELCNCGRRGCLEAHAGGLAIVREGRRRIPEFHTTPAIDPTNLTVHDVFQLAEQGNAAACELTAQVVRYIGIGLVNLTNLNSLELIAISGGISNAPRKLLFDPLVTFVRNHAYETIADKIRICLSSLGEDAPLIGAALLHHTAAHTMQPTTD